MRRANVAILLCSLAWSVSAGSRSVWDGVYTRAQAARGKTVYAEICARCHGTTFLGGDDAAPLVGAPFLTKWSGKTVGDLVDVIRKDMPSDGPGIVTRREASDVVAYLLSVNAFPTGQTELEIDDAPLKDIRIEPKR